MKFKIIHHPGVKTDIAEAKDWYSQKQPGLGIRFVIAVREEFRNLPNDPLIHRLQDPLFGVRWLGVPHFPHRIVYRVEGSTIKVLAVHHTAQDDQHWRKRAASKF